MVSRVIVCLPARVQQVPEILIRRVRDRAREKYSHRSRKTLSEVFDMPRPKGSKNKKSSTASTPAAITVDEINSKMATLESEISELTETIKSKKAELKELNKLKVAAEAAAAEKKAEEDKKAILDAVEKSGKSVEEILEMLK